MLRRRWIVAIGLSFVAHAGLVLALTPSEPALDEAGSGAGSNVVGSVDAIVGIDMPVETPSEAEPAAALEPTETTETSAAEAEPPPPAMDVAALQPAEVSPTRPPTSRRPLRPPNRQRFPSLSLSRLPHSPTVPRPAQLKRPKSLPRHRSRRRRHRRSRPILRRRRPLRPKASLSLP